MLSKHLLADFLRKEGTDSSVPVLVDSKLDLIVDRNHERRLAESSPLRAFLRFESRGNDDLPCLIDA